MSFVPTSYEDWKHCITVKCGIPLTSSYVEQRIAALSDRSDYNTERFIERWGEAQYERTIGWFKEAAAELSGQA